jgi:hypothetical protein
MGYRCGTAVSTHRPGSQAPDENDPGFARLTIESSPARLRGQRENQKPQISAPQPRLRGAVLRVPSCHRSGDGRVTIHRASRSTARAQIGIPHLCAAPAALQCNRPRAPTIASTAPAAPHAYPALLPRRLRHRGSVVKARGSALIRVELHHHPTAGRAGGTGAVKGGWTHRKRLRR